MSPVAVLISSPELHSFRGVGRVPGLDNQERIAICDKAILEDLGRELQEEFCARGWLQRAVGREAQARDVNGHWDCSAYLLHLLMGWDRCGGTGFRPSLRTLPTSILQTHPAQVGQDAEDTGQVRHNSG